LEPALGLPGSLLELTGQYVGDLGGKRVCVLASRDNLAAFALAGLGARVTSVDISPVQLNIAAERANELELDIEFVRGDVADLSDLPGETFDLALSTNGVAVWITELGAYYVEVNRLLRPGGVFLSFDIHPFQRPWADHAGYLEMGKTYFDNRPKEFLYDPQGAILGLAAEVAPEARRGALPGFRCHWTLGDLLMGLINAHLELVHVVEEPSTDLEFWQGEGFRENPNPDLLDWRRNPRAGLPAWLTLVAKRPH
jgi:SAM-dependent methyltransferase